MLMSAVGGCQDVAKVLQRCSKCQVFSESRYSIVRVLPSF